MSDPKMAETQNPNKAESQVTLASAKNGTVVISSKQGWMDRRTRLEKRLMFVAAALAFSVAGLAISLTAVATRHQGSRTKHSIVSAEQRKTSSPYQSFGSNGRVCDRKECVTAASEILNRIDESVSPCDDFFEFSCGNYVKSQIIPDEKTSVTQFSEIHDVLQEKLRLVIEEEFSYDDPFSTRLVKNLYTSCMNTDRVEAKGVEPIEDILRAMGGWPVVEGDGWDESNFTWTDAIYRHRKLGYSVDYLVDFSVTIDVKNSSWRIIDIDQALLGMPSRKYLIRGVNDSDVQAYYQHQIDLAVILGADEERAKEEMLEALEFEIMLASFSLDEEERRNMSKLYNKMTLGDLQRMVPEIPWVEYINNLLPSHLEVTESEPVVVNVPSFVKELGKLLVRTPKRTIANYLRWRVAGGSAAYLSNDVRDIQLKFSRKLSGNKSRPPRWKECMQAVSSSLSHAVGSLYAQKFFREDAKAEADEMVSYIRAEFEEILSTVDWMDELTRTRAIHKARAIVTHIAYPKELLMEDKLSELYDGLEITDGDLLESMRNLTKFGTNYSFGKLRERVDKQHWRNHGSAAEVNAFYSPLENAIQFPAGILQGVFFNANRPKYLNYGGIGFVIGHEITHGFDDRGRQFDEVGDLYNWWDQDTQKKFIDKSKCIIWQYGNYTAPEIGIKVNGINTQGENIADNGGIKQAYRAYNKWVKRNGEEELLPGLKYTPKQLFWIASAHVWCSKYRPEALKVRVITGFHSPVQFRVNGPLSNAPEFSKDWSCPLGTKMNPHHKCTVW